MRNKRIAIAHSLSRGADTRVEVLLLGLEQGRDREFSGAACASMYRMICQYSQESKATRLSEYLDGRRWKSQKLRRDLLILRNVIPQHGIECVCSYIRSFLFDLQNLSKKNRMSGVWISQKYFTAQSVNQDGYVSAWNLRSPPLPTQENAMDFSWAHVSIDHEARVLLRERSNQIVYNGELIPSYDNRRMSLGWFGRPDVIAFKDDDDIWVRILSSNMNAYVSKILSR